ncbi:MAG TPA: hypothetical protein VMQ54_11280 [Steroidobacteraceae bacterium]|jgi:hypothetical protein|nr:hypothetical protein [Steroidobacteraceae bacterium]
MTTHYREQQDIQRVTDALIEAGIMGAGVAEDAVAVFTPRVEYVNDRAMVGRQTLADAIKAWTEAEPHRQPQKAASELDMNNLSDRATAQKTMRPDLFAQLLTDWQLRGPGDTRKGIRPGSQNGDGTHKNNPWKNLRGADGSIDPKALARCTEFIRVAGAAASVKMAAAVGSTLDGRPLRGA